MAYVPVRMEWRQGINGDLGTYVFSPNPSIHRASPGKRTATHEVPLLDGVIIQNLGRAERNLELIGILYNKTNSWDDMETSRNNLINGLGTGPGQLHLISPQRHIRYDGQITTDGIQFDSQTRSNFQDYTIRFIIPNSLEINVTETTRTILSNTTVI